MLTNSIKKYWFLLGLMLVFALVMFDADGLFSRMGVWLKQHNGPDAAIVLIFFFSGFTLNTNEIRSGLKDIKGTLITLSVIFIVAPAIAAIIGILPIPVGVKIGIFLVAVMPTTLSSGVVMTGAAGGNMAHALLITLIANSISVITIPFALELLLKLASTFSVIEIDKASIIIKIGLCVLVPLGFGLLIKFFSPSGLNLFSKRHAGRIQIVNQCLVLIIVWMGLAGAVDQILSGRNMVAFIIILVAGFHGLLLCVCFLFIRIFHVKRGKRESIVFMGGQKTLPLSVILQVALFPQYRIALVICVVHHVVHLLIDGWLAAKMAADR